MKIEVTKLHHHEIYDKRYGYTYRTQCQYRITEGNSERFGAASTYGWISLPVMQQHIEQQHREWMRNK